jgi:hypothetical protein
MVEIHKPPVDSSRPVSAHSGHSPAAWLWLKGPKTVNHPHQVGLGELLSMASTRLRNEVGGPIGVEQADL